MEASEEASERASSESKSPKAGVIDATAGSDYANTLQSSRTSQQASWSPSRAYDIMMSSGLAARIICHRRCRTSITLPSWTRGRLQQQTRETHQRHLAGLQIYYYYFFF